MTSGLDARSEKSLQGVHPDLVRVVRECAETCPIAFTVTEGLRSELRQAVLFKQGASKTMKSRHLTGHAIDVAAMIDFDGDGDLEIRWDWPLYKQIADAMKKAAQLLNIPIEWGGDWKTHRDGPHFQLPHKEYRA
jgi:peptidoglycan L-alanyl-D-glutamate endopeptidase CwlK